ncbi:MAG: glycosyltransferase family 2 protein [Chloroflexi bacterium]|nr:glycosyltransferase family 2 protein [Chloroflexota bacterium]
MIPGLVSVIIPTYNQAQYVGQAIESALGQTYGNTEIIVVNDGSTDEAFDVVARYGERVCQLVQSNAGLAAARNSGIRRARGEYIAFLDSDDVWLPGKLAAQMAVLRAMPDAGLVYAGYYLVDADLCIVGQARVTGLFPPRPRRLPGTGADRQAVASPGDASLRLSMTDRSTTELPRAPTSSYEFLRAPTSSYEFLRAPTPGSIRCVLPRNEIGVLTVMVRAVWLDRVGLFEPGLSPSADWDLWIRLALAGCPFAAAAEPLALYRIHAANMSSNPQRMTADSFATLDRAFAHPAAGVLGEALKLASVREQHLLASLRYEAAGNEEKAADHLREALALARREVDPFDLAARYAHWSPLPSAVSDDLADRRLRRLRDTIAALRSGEAPAADETLARVEAAALLVMAKLALRRSPRHSARLLRTAIGTAPAILRDPRLYGSAIGRLSSRLGRLAGDRAQQTKGER